MMSETRNEIRRARRHAFQLACVATLACLSLVLMAACRQRETATNANANASDAQSATASRPQRIVSLSPNVTEILYGVGAFDRVVAVSDYCTYPAEVANLPRVGGWQNTNIERVAALHPDLVILTEAQAPFVKDRLDALRIPTLVVPSRTLSDAFSAIEQTGRATGNEAEAQRLAAETRAAVEDVRARTRTLARRRVLCVVDRVPGTLRDLYTASRGSYLSEIIEAAGGESIAPPAEVGYGRISKEAVVTLDPEIIIDMVQGAQGTLAEDPQAVWRELSQVRAVRDRRIFPLRDPSVLHASQFVGATARRFAEIIHPEAFAGGTTTTTATPTR